MGIVPPCRDRRALVRPLVAPAAVFVVACTARPAHAWIFVEHTSIGRAAVDELPATARKVLEVAWLEFRKSGNLGSDVVCANVGRPDTPIEQSYSAAEPDFATCVDLPMLAALAGDHSCDPADLTATVRSTWVRPLVRAFWANYSEIRETELDSPARVNLWHEQNLAAERLDEQYLSRAKGTGAHFVLPRTRVLLEGFGEAERAYARRVANLGAPVSAVGNYVGYHARALSRASGAGCAGAGSCMNPDLAREAILFEAFALHFLEDAFSSGHVVGVPADSSSSARLGTHDYYCQEGLSVVTWSGLAYPAHGDAHLRALDKEIVSGAVASSLGQLAQALAGVAVGACADAPVPGDVCSSTTTRPTPGPCVDAMQDVLTRLPAPPLDETMDPDFRNDVGLFVRFGLDSFLGAGWTTHAAAPAEPPPQGVPTWGLNAGVGLGFSTAALTTSSSDALGYGQVGLGAESGQRSTWCLQCNVTSQEPLESRIGLDFQIRLPYCFIPGDFVPLGLLALAGWKWAFNRVVQSAEGGFYWRWQRVRRLGRAASWQIVAGRELEFTTFSSSRVLDGASTGFAHSFALGGNLVEFTLSHSFSEVLGGRVRASLGYRYEQSQFTTGATVLAGHFFVLSLASDSHLYVSGF